MTWIEGSFLLFGGLVAVMGLGLPVAFAFLVLNVIGAWLFLGGEPGLSQLARNAVQSITSFALTPIPFFVLMGEVLFHTGIALRAIDAFALLIRRVPGRLAVIAIVAGTVFSAISGSTIATTALLGSLMLPTMLQRGYDPRMAMGPIMGIGGVDMLIPPSALTVLLGSLAGISISGLLIGGIVPGLILSVMYVGYIVLRATLNPALAPEDPIAEAGPQGAARWAPFLLYVLPLVLIFGLVIGAMTRGWATPTEAAALGAAGTIVFAAAYRSLTIDGLMKALMGTVAVSGIILFIIVGATTFSQVLSFSGVVNGMIGLVTGLGLSVNTLIIVMLLILLFLGLLRRSGQHDADHAAVLHAAGAAAQRRSDLVRRAVPDLHAAWTADAAVRAAAVHDEGRGAEDDHDARSLHGVHAVYRDERADAGPDLRAAEDRDLAAGIVGRMTTPPRPSPRSRPAPSARTVP